MQNAELEENIRHRQQAIDTLEEDVKRLQSGVDQMAHELEAKGKEILNIRSEANRTLRCVSIFWVFLCPPAKQEVCGSNPASYLC